MARSRYDAYAASNWVKPPDLTCAIAGLDLAEYGGDAKALCLRYDNFVAPIAIWDGMNIIGSCHRVLSECRHKKV